MTSKLYLTDFDILKREVQAYFKDFHNWNLVISHDDQLQEIELLKETIKAERFFFVVNLQTFELEDINGLQRYLGYREADFTYKYYWNQVIHPGKEALKILARTMYESLCTGKHPLRFLVQRFTSLVPLRHYDGHYILTKKTSSTFQYDVNNRLVSYIDEFTIIGEYNGEPLSPRIYNTYGEIGAHGPQELLNSSMEKFISMKIFSPNEFQVVRKVAYTPNVTQAQIANELGLTVHTVNTYYKRFLFKARDFFEMDFDNINDTAAYLKRECII